MQAMTGGITYFPTHDFRSARKLQGFEKIGEAGHIQGEGHRFIFLKNWGTGECAIRIKHITDSQTYIFEDVDTANRFYQNTLKAAGR